jgi:hypothetical protein
VKSEDGYIRAKSFSLALSPALIAIDYKNISKGKA